MEFQVLIPSIVVQFRAAAGLFRAPLSLRYGQQPFRKSHSAAHTKPLPSLPQATRMAVLLCTVWLSSCTANISIPLPPGEERIVVEGYIENGLPPVVVLSRSQPYFGDVGPGSITAAFVRNATVTVSDGSRTIVLIEVAASALPPELRDLLRTTFGLDLRVLIDSLGFEFYFYTPADFTFVGEVGKHYSLDVQAEGKRLTAVTTLPPPNPVDSLIVTPHPEPEKYDTLYSLSVRYSDPPGVRNFVRYFTRRNSEPFYPGFFNSVLDDASRFAVDGQTFNFPIERGWNRADDPDDDLYIYFVAGDTVTLRWAAVDEAHHGFWASLEFDRASVGNPFASPIVIRSNIQGGLGIWGGYSTSYHTVVLPQ